MRLKVVKSKAKQLKKSKFPVLKGEPVWVLRQSSYSLCPQCKKARVMGTYPAYPTIILMGGAMRVVDRKSKSAEIADDCIGFLDLCTHNEHGNDVMVDIVDDTPSGQFEMYFCSTRCLRAFFDMCVNDLETKMTKSKVKRR